MIGQQYPYTPQFYPNQSQSQSQTAIQNPTSNIIFVQGDSGADNFYLGPNSSVILMDKDNPVVYIRSTDAIGRPNATEKYYLVNEQDYAKLQGPAPEYISKEEFEEYKKYVEETYSVKRTKA